MSLRPCFLAALTALACTSTEPPPLAPTPAPVETAPSGPAPAPVEPPAAPAPLPASTLPWVWYHAYPEVLCDAFTQVGTGQHAYDHRVGDERRYFVTRGDRGLLLLRERMVAGKGEEELLWTRDVTRTRPLGDPVAQVLMGPPTLVVVALRIPGGYERHVFTDEGEPRARSIVLDPPGFPSQDAALQLGGTSERPVVYVRGTGGAYLDEIDPATAEPAARASFGAELLHERFAWPPKGPGGERFGHRFPAEGGGHYQALRRGDAIELLATDPAGAQRWRTTLDPKGAAWSDTAVLLEHADAVVIVVHGGITSGATAHVVDRERGTLRATSSPGSIGSIGHSQYRNEVALALGDGGHVLVHGHEAGGDYLGVLDVAAGTLLGHEVWRE